MSLDPFFSLSPLSPYAYTYDAANPNAPYTYAHIHTYGGHTGAWSPERLADQYNSDQILLGYNSVPETDQTVADLGNDVYRRSAARIAFKGFNVKTVNQYLLVFRLARRAGSPIAQFFIGTQFVRAEALTVAPYDDIAILLDTPGETFVSLIVRLAAADALVFHSFFFKGVDCYLL